MQHRFAARQRVYGSKSFVNIDFYYYWFEDSEERLTRERTSMSTSAGYGCGGRDGTLDVDALEDAKRTRGVSASSASYRS